MYIKINIAHSLIDFINTILMDLTPEHTWHFWLTMTHALFFTLNSTFIEELWM